MTTPTMINHDRLHRKTLGSQIDRLDSMLEGLAENLNDAVAQAVKETVSQVVREAVAVTVQEVLSNPELLRAALARHMPPTPEAQPAPMPQRRSFTAVIQSGWSWLGRQVTQAKEKLGQGLTWCAEKVRQVGAALWNRRRRWLACCVGTMTALGTAGLALWRLRRSCALALTAGLLAGVSGYFGGPLLCALLSAVGGMALTLSAMLLLPLWNLLRTCTTSNTSE